MTVHRSGRRGLARGLPGVLTLAGLLSMPAVSGAQEWRFEALGGKYRYENSPVGGGSGTGLLGLRYLHGASWLAVLGGVPLTSADAPWGTVTSSLRLATGRRPVELGVRLSAQAFAQGTRGDTASGPDSGLPPFVRDIPLGRRGPLGGGMEPSLSGWGASGEITPLVALRSPSVSVEARAGVAAFHSDFADQAFDRTLGVAHLRVSGAVSPSLVLSAEGRSQWAEEGTYPYVGATAFMARGRVDAWGSVGTWLAEGVETTPWAVGTALRLGERVSLSGSVRRDAFDPLFQTPERTSWSVGISVVLGRRPTPRAPVPARYDNGVATIVLPAGEAAGPLMVAGDFNDWKPQAMTLRDGRWTLEVPLRPGVYYYAFVAPDGSWFVPESVAGRKPDGFGGHVAVLVVG
ncbi:MAG TPA: glycogen-binding domain-containing protein [Longimicrobiales bacterium]|nr:glycogen-binding domain-containing protein [Longimicrobiales bacterium]